MSKHVQGPELFRFELKIEEMVDHYRGKYEYRGRAGGEYEVIQSLFHEINSLTDLGNRQILWYAVIIFLVDHYLQYRSNWLLSAKLSAKKGQPNFSVAMDRSFLQTGDIPAYIDVLESYVISIARLGVLLSTKMTVPLEYKKIKGHEQSEILSDLMTRIRAAEANTASNDLYFLLIKEASENLIKLLNYGPEAEQFSGLTGQIRLIYQQILPKIEVISKNRQIELHNMNDFWNGLIP